MNLTIRILIGMLSGVLCGALLQQFADPAGVVGVYLVDGLLDGLGTIFIKLLKLLVVPLVFFSLVCGAASLAATGAIGRLGGKTIGLYLMTTAIAVTLALTVALIVQPGSGSDIAAPTGFEARTPPTLKETFVNVVPDNPIAAMANGSMLQIILFAILFGIALSKAGEPGERIRAIFEDVNVILMTLITMLIQLAPIGVFCLMAKLFFSIGWQEFGKLIVYFLTVAGVLVLHLLIVYPTILRLFTGLSPRTFLTKMREPILVAFSTSSSAATLPVTLRTVEERVGVKNQIASFAVPLGATINMDGTAIMQGVATVFIAQFYGIELGLTQYLMVILTATLASIGTAAAPSVGILMLTMVLAQVGLPVEGIMLIIGVDRLLDMMRTAVNVCGDSMVATVVAHSEDKLDLEVFEDPDAGRVIQPEAA